MGDVCQFSKCISGREQVKAMMAAQEKRTCDRILEVAYEQALDRDNLVTATWTSNKKRVTKSKAHSESDIFFTRVWLLEKVLQQAKEEHRQRSRKFLGLS
jgi:hypothetical protein